MFNTNNFKIHLNTKKNFLVRGIFLVFGWSLGIDRFYEGNKKAGVLSIHGWSIIFLLFYTRNILVKIYLRS